MQNTALQPSARHRLFPPKSQSGLDRGRGPRATHWERTGAIGGGGTGGMTLGLINANPVIQPRRERAARGGGGGGSGSVDPHAAEDAVDALDVFDFVRDIRDPEHPYSLEQLSVLSEESITVDEKLGRIQITFTPTVQHCSMATVIGLCLRVKLMRCFPPHYKVDINVAPGSHANEESVNKQLNDKERVAAALENPNLRQLVDECLYSNEL